ncbi:MAG: DNA-binding response regulator [Cyanobacteria bacterium P01_F01_bin.86]
MTPEQTAEIVRLREANVAPKQIARKLGLRPAEVKTFIRENAEGAYLAKAQKGTLEPLHECIINQSAAERLLEGKALEEGEGVGGMAQILLARQDRNRYIVCSYLVDYWCLGVKDAVPPRKLGYNRYEEFKRLCIMQFQESFVDISLAQAQSIIYGAVDYAGNLGFEPGGDFNTKAQAHLGLKPETLIPIEFGKDGQPFYISGPYDKPDKIIKTLTANVGEDNFHYVAGIESFDDEFWE